MNDWIAIDLDKAWREARSLRRDLHTATRLVRDAAASPGPVTRIHGPTIVSDLGERRLTLIAVASLIDSAEARARRILTLLVRSAA